MGCVKVAELSRTGWPMVDHEEFCRGKKDARFFENLHIHSLRRSSLAHSFLWLYPK